MKYLLFITNAWHYLQQSDGTNLILWVFNSGAKNWHEVGESKEDSCPPPKAG